MRRAPASACSSAAGVVPLHVERLGAVGERVHGGPHGRLRGQLERELGLVDDRGGMRAAAATSHPPLRVADAEVARPLRTGVRRRHRDERQSGGRRDRLAEVDVLPPPTASTPSASRAAATARGRGRRAPLATVSSVARKARASPSAGRPRETATVTPASAQAAGSASSPQRTITPAGPRLQALSREARRTPARRASRHGRSRARAGRRAPARAPDTRDRQRPCREVSLDRDARDERRAEAAEHRGARRLLQPELELHVQVAQPEPELAQLVVDHLPDAGALLHEDERLGLQLLEGQALAGALVLGRDGEDDLVAVEGLERDAAMTACGPDDAELELAPPDLLDDRVRVGHGQRDVHLRMEAAGTRRAGRAGRCRRGRSRRRSRAGP